MLGAHLVCMFEVVVSIIFVISLGGLLFMLARKIPILVTLSKNGGGKGAKHRYILSIEGKIKKVSIFFEKQIFLHRFLLWIKIMVVKIEVKIDSLLHKIRKKAQQRDKDINDKK